MPTLVPFDDLAGMARVRCEANAMGLPVMADESVLDHATLINIIKADAADIVTQKIDMLSGSMAVPGEMGLGVTLDEAKIAQYRFYIVKQ